MQQGYPLYPLLLEIKQFNSKNAIFTSYIFHWYPYILVKHVAFPVWPLYIYTYKGIRT